MKVLIFGPSGSGKTYIATKLKQLGVNAFDDSEIEDYLIGMIAMPM